MEPIKDSSVEFKIDRLPKDLQEQFRRLYVGVTNAGYPAAY